MALKCGFAEIDITPEPGIEKIGWLKVVVSDHVADPLYARAAVLDSEDTRIAFVQLDTLFVPATMVEEVRRRCAAEWGFPGAHLTIAATHNHAGPAMDTVGLVAADTAYVRELTGKLVAVVGEALAAMTDAEVGFARAFEFDVAYNRRVMMRDGTTRTGGSFADPDALCFEGPIDPEVAVLAARAPGGGPMLGAMVNFACHAGHHGPDGALSAGFPGVLAAAMKSRGCPVTLFCLGAAGNISYTDATRDGAATAMDRIGEALADDVVAAMEKMTFSAQVRLGCRAKRLRLPFRELTGEQIDGTAHGAQRVIDSAIYDRTIPAEVERIRRLGSQDAEVQVFFVNDVAFAAVGAEWFVEFGLDIKRRVWPTQAVVVSCANGRLGYVPTRQAFDRGGYETTFSPWSCLAPEAGDMLADAVVDLIDKEANR